LLLAVAGCGEADPRQYEVHGTVNWEGKPLPEGDIAFIPQQKEFRPEAGKIKDGKYRFRSRAGPMRVEIQATRPLPGKLGPMGEPAIEDYIPARYNSESTLHAEVGDGKTQFDFSLTPQ